MEEWKKGYHTDVQCMHMACTKRFHPICGRRNSYRMEWVDGGGLQSFCEKHGKKKRTRARAIMDISESGPEDDEM